MAKKKKTPRYIDANLAINELTGWDTDATDEEIEYTINKIPTANVEEVKHGRWFDTGSFDHHYTPIYQCSVCRKEVADNFIDLHKYCLHCGAKMDAKKEG